MKGGQYEKPETGIGILCVCYRLLTGFDAPEESKNIKFRAELLTSTISFFDSFDLLFNTNVGENYWIQAKRLGYILWRINDRYKDETVDLKGASDLDLILQQIIFLLFS